ncbi:DNA (cytosine-5)-methyltransferase 1 [Sphingobacterium zeae]|uniref:Cytosine-specific methyltransferase n=1 Tax=Sphingobacterium zeae TaxID=1776859 RepID=A0ABU0U899_9SPHI|nr:DNA cytosine methyltransferase [Sphingobacterium zeae]MDQ1151192.1 DNA (cytosine-5)-methyltransferase 1 [Sphingobacterium zeae]
MKVKNTVDKVSVEQLIEEKHRNKKSELDIYDAYLTHYLQVNSESIFHDYAIQYAREIINRNPVDLQIVENKSINTYDYFLPIDAPFKAVENPTFKFIDLFAGVGGFRMAMQNIGGKAVFSSEFENNAKFTYASNYGEVPFGDITKEETKAAIPQKFDILCGGFPCQAFSIAGNRKGFSDTRGTLFFEIEKIVETHHPKVVFLENVKNLLTHDKGNTYRVIKEILEKKLGYVVYEKVLNSMTHANVPQNRERIFIVAFDPLRVPNHVNFEFPGPIELTKTIHDVLEPGKQEDKYYYKKNHMYYSELDRTMKSRDTLYQWRRVYVRENKNNVCPTLTANMGAGGHNVPLVRDEFGIRKLTPRECFYFQGYPANFVTSKLLADSKLYMQAGNSVTMPLIQRIAENILGVL